MEINSANLQICKSCGNAGLEAIAVITGNPAKQKEFPYMDYCTMFFISSPISKKVLDTPQATYCAAGYNAAAGNCRREKQVSKTFFHVFYLHFHQCRRQILDL